MDPNLLFTQVTAGAACAYVLRLIQRWDKLPWVTQHTKTISMWFRIVMSFAATVGIGFQWNGTAHSLLITGLSFPVVALGVWHWFGQYALQHEWGQVFNIGTLQAVESPITVTDVKGDQEASVKVGK